MASTKQQTMLLKRDSSFGQKNRKGAHHKNKHPSLKARAGFAKMSSFRYQFCYQFFFISNPIWPAESQMFENLRNLASNSRASNRNRKFLATLIGFANIWFIVSYLWYFCLVFNCESAHVYDYLPFQGKRRRSYGNEWEWESWWSYPWWSYPWWSYPWDCAPQRQR